MMVKKLYLVKPSDCKVNGGIIPPPFGQSQTIYLKWGGFDMMIDRQVLLMHRGRGDKRTGHILFPVRAFVGLLLSYLRNVASFVVMVHAQLSS